MPSSDQQSTVNSDSKLSHPNQSETLCRPTMNDVPADFLPLSHAIDRLADGMWGGLQRPEPVAVIKQDQKSDASICWPRTVKLAESTACF